MTTVEHRSGKPERWLASRRLKVALWIAVAEAILAAFDDNISRWTILALAIGATALYVGIGRRTSSRLLRNVLWVFAVSQLLAVVAALLAVALKWLAIVLAVLFAVAALLFLLFDRGR